MSSASAAFEVQTDPVPIAVDAEGVVRVGGTRVLLDLVVFAFNEGQTPEQVVDDFPTLKLADVYAVFAYYLRHRASIDEYLARRQEEADAFREEWLKRFPQTGLRERLLARRKPADAGAGS